MKLMLFAAALAVVSSPVASQGMDSMSLANELGSVLASEEPCGLTYDQVAIAAFIDANVPADDMGFASMLGTMTRGHAFQLEDMSASSKVAHCTQVKRVSVSHGFIGD